MKNSQTIIDVRTAEEYQGGHVDGAINIPVDKIANRIEEIKEMAQPIVAYCASGNRSGMAVSILKQNGITDVINGGGINDMKQQNN